MPLTICETLVTFGKMHLPYLALEIFAIGLIFTLKCGRKDSAELSQQIKKSSESFISFSFIRCTLFFILAVFVMASLLPKLVFWWTSHFVRLMALQGLLISAAIVAAVGATGLAFSLMKTKGGKCRPVYFNVLFLLILAAHLMASISMNFMYGWEISWFTAIAVPYLGSILSFEPNIELLNNCPWLVQLYLVQGLFVFAIAPFFSVTWVIFNPKCQSPAKS